MTEVYKVKYQRKKSSYNLGSLPRLSSCVVKLSSAVSNFPKMVRSLRVRKDDYITIDVDVSDSVFNRAINMLQEHIDREREKVKLKFINGNKVLRIGANFMNTRYVEAIVFGRECFKDVINVASNFLTRCSSLTLLFFYKDSFLSLRSFRGHDSIGLKRVFFETEDEWLRLLESMDSVRRREICQLKFFVGSPSDTIIQIPREQLIMWLNSYEL